MLLQKQVGHIDGADRADGADEIRGVQAGHQGKNVRRGREDEPALEQGSQRLALLRGCLDSLAAQLGQLSPVKVLERGYALVQDEHGRLLRRAADTAPGQSLRVRLHEGRLGVEVRDIE